MEKKRLSKKAVLLWRWRITLLAVFISFILGVLYFFLKFLAIVICIVFFVVYCILMIIYFPMLYKSSYYSITDNHIIIEKGIIVKKVVNISLSRIQYVEIVADPLQRLLKLNTIVLHTAGSQKIITPLDTIESKRIKQIIECTYEKE